MRFPPPIGLQLALSPVFSPRCLCRRNFPLNPANGGRTPSLTRFSTSARAASRAGRADFVSPLGTSPVVRTQMFARHLLVSDRSKGCAALHRPELGFCWMRSVHSSTIGVACVPIYFAGHVHYDCQPDKQRDCAHEQRVILLPKSDVKKQENTRQSGADHECAHAAPEEKAAIPCDQQRRCHRRDQVSPTESDKFRNRQQQQVK